MFRAIPTNSKLCFNHDLKRNWKIHDDKIKAMKSNVSRDKPQYFNFLQQRPKKAVIQETRNIEIQKQNSCLLRKIKDIEKKGRNRGNFGYSGEVKVCSPNKNDRKSLNQPYRKRVLVQIVEENQNMLKRIHQKKSVYNVKKWEKQRQKVQKNISLLSQFPYKGYKQTQTKVNLWMTDEDFTKKSRVRNTQHKKSETTRDKNPFIYSGTQKIGQSYYLVQTYTSKYVFNLELENLQDQTQKYRLQINQQQIQKLLNQQYDGKMRNLIQKITINKELGTCSLKI